MTTYNDIYMHTELSYKWANLWTLHLPLVLWCSWLGIEKSTCTRPAKILPQFPSFLLVGLAEME